MSTSGAMRVRRTGDAAGRPRASYVYLAGSPRRARKRRRAVLLLVASVALLVPIGLQIHRITADHSTVYAPLTQESALPNQQGASPVINDAPAQPPEAGSIDPALSRALGKAQVAARAAGLDLQVTSGFRSAATQQRLYDEAITKYGSPEIARRWVLPPAESAHVQGRAVDVGPPAAAQWLEKHGVRYGLCRRYLNEGWHFERLAPAIGQPCPALEPYAGG
jgi:D-alanyl-D-alanine carboxypeptidase